MRRDVRILLVGDGQNLGFLVHYAISFAVNRGCWEEYYSHISNKRVIRRSRMLGSSLSSIRTDILFVWCIRFSTSFRRLQFRRK